MWALGCIVARLLTIKTMHARLTSFCVSWCDWHQLPLVLLLRSWWIGLSVAWPLTIVVGRSPYILVHVLRHVIMLSGILLVSPHVPSSVGVGFVLVIAVVITKVVVITIVVIMAMVIIIPVIAIASTVVIPSTIVIIPPIVLIANVVVLPVAVVVPITGSWPITFPVGWKSACLWLGWLWFDLSDWRNILVQ